MCGIVGYFGRQDVKEVLLGGLKRLEYRGYDSSGIAVLRNKNLEVFRASGKLIELEQVIAEEVFDSGIGIGHTRWATHGKPTTKNAHPHKVEGVVVVHNGIIENHSVLRNELLKKGAQIRSDTDSEIIAHLIAFAVRDTSDLVRAVELVLPELQGAYSVLVLWEGQSEKMVAFKNGPPLIIGHGEDDLHIASDVQALITHTNKVTYLDDFELAIVDGGNISFRSPSGVEIQKEVVEIDWGPEVAEKSGFPHFMLKEIHEQPRALAHAIKPHIDIGNRTIQLQTGRDFNDLQDVQKIAIIGCGTSYYAGMVGKYLVERWAKIPVEVDIASEFRYRSPILTSDTLCVLISQSGETADTLAVQRMAQKKGVRTLSICNVPRSSIDREADFHLYMNAGVETGVASTKAFISSLALLNLLAAAFGRQRNYISGAEESVIVQALLECSALMEQVLVYDSYFAETASSLKAHKGILYMGRGVHYPIALEGALKLKELAYMHAEGYAAGEMKHGPLALIDERILTVMLAPQDELFQKTLSNIEEARARGARVIALGSGNCPNLERLSDSYLVLPEAEWFILPILETIPLQLLAYHVAHAMGHDVDQPRNLAKSVTVE